MKKLLSRVNWRNQKIENVFVIGGVLFILGIGLLFGFGIRPTFMLKSKNGVVVKVSDIAKYTIVGYHGGTNSYQCMSLYLNTCDFRVVNSNENNARFFKTSDTVKLRLYKANDEFMIKQAEVNGIIVIKNNEVLGYIVFVITIISGLVLLLQLYLKKVLKIKFPITYKKPKNR